MQSSRLYLFCGYPFPSRPPTVHDCRSALIADSVPDAVASLLMEALVMANTAQVPTKATQSESIQDHGQQRPNSASTEQRPPEPSWGSWFTDPLIFATLWLAVATTALFYFTYRLWSATKSLASDTKSSGEAQ